MVDFTAPEGREKARFIIHGIRPINTKDPKVFLKNTEYKTSINATKHRLLPANAEN